MPSRLNGRDRTLFLATSVGAVLLTAITVAIGSSDEAESRVPSTYSAQSGGAKAAFLALRDSGYAVRRWERPPGELPMDGTATLVLAEPNGVSTPAEREAVRRFVTNGGRVIATGVGAILFIPDAAALPNPRAAVTFKRIQARAPSPITRAAAVITLDPAAHWLADSAGVVLYGDDQARVVEYRVGGGQVIWWASPTPLTNAGITEPGNLEFTLACLGDRSRPIVWDEYFHGYRDSLAGSIAVSRFRLLILPLALGLFAVVITYSRRSGPIVPAPRENRLSPLEFVRTLGMLYQRAGAASVAVDVAYRRFCYQLTRRLGMAPTSPIADLERAITERRQLSPRALSAVLYQCEAARAQQHLTPNDALRLTQALAEYSSKLGLS